MATNACANNGENSGKLTSLPVNRLNGSACNADAYAKIKEIMATNVDASQLTIGNRLQC